MLVEDHKTRHSSSLEVAIEMEMNLWKSQGNLYAILLTAARRQKSLQSQWKGVQRPACWKSKDDKVWILTCNRSICLWL